MKQRRRWPVKRPPRNAAETISELARTGSTKKGIAHRLGTSLETLSAWMEQYPALQDAFDAGREGEHLALYTKMFELAMAGNVVANIFLMKTRHGYREGDPIDQGNRVSINFQLPGAMSLSAFGKVIEHGSEADQPERLSAAPATRS